MGVANQVQVMVNQDAANEHPQAVVMKDKITRKLVKQTVMTYTYGVTFIGGKQQVENRLREWRDDQMAVRGVPKDEVMSDEDLSRCARYITERIFAALGTLFEGARKIQMWLNRSALLISQSVDSREVLSSDEKKIMEWLKMKGLLKGIPTSVSEDLEAVSNPISLADFALKDEDEPFHEDEEGTVVEVTDIVELEKKEIKHEKREAVPRMTSVIWTTPLGLPVVQPYRNHNLRAVKTEIQTVSITDFARAGPVNARKQSTAFPPNFIHSLDATHMMLSAITCYNHGITFASVHDSYWTHAADIDRMNNILRDCFVKVHETDIMARLREEFNERYQDFVLPHQVLLDATQLEDFQAFCAKEGIRAQFGRNVRDPVVDDDSSSSGAVDDSSSNSSKGKASGKAPKKPNRVGKKKPVHTWKYIEFEDRPVKGDFNIRQVLDSPYFFH